MPVWKYIVLFMVLLPVTSAPTVGQSADESLGDIARALRKNQAPPRTIIDNDNLPAVMEAGQDQRWGTSGLHFSLGQDTIQVVNASNPDVTCALTFTANQSDPLADSARWEKLPPTELAKLDGLASMLDDSLVVSVHNGSEWEVREITVGLTIVRPSAAKQATTAQHAPTGKLVPAAVNTEEAPVEKPSDITVLYHLKGLAAPLSKATFHQPLSTALSRAQQWHWAIVQAKGMPPAAPPKPDPSSP